MYKANFGRELTIILLIKLTLLYGVWNVCFKNTKQTVSGAALAAKLYANSNNTNRDENA